MTYVVEEVVSPCRPDICRARCTADMVHADARTLHTMRSTSLWPRIMETTSDGTVNATICQQMRCATLGADRPHGFSRR
eukprot:1001010-Rhodomonas_salina.2